MVEVVGDDVEVAVVLYVQEGDGPGAAGERGVADVGPGDRLPARGGFDTKLPGPLDESAVPLIHKELVGPVEVRVAHARGDEEVQVRIVVEVPRGDPPGPPGLEAGSVRDLLESAVPAVDEEAIAEDEGRLRGLSGL